MEGHYFTYFVIVNDFIYYSFNARIKILTEMYFSHQYLSIDQKKIWPRPL